MKFKQACDNFLKRINGAKTYSELASTLFWAVLVGVGIGISFERWTFLRTAIRDEEWVQKELSFAQDCRARAHDLWMREKLVRECLDAKKPSSPE